MARQNNDSEKCHVSESSKNVPHITNRNVLLVANCGTAILHAGPTCKTVTNRDARNKIR